MNKLLYAAATSFLRAFGITFLLFAPGIFEATNESAAASLSIAALCASLVAGFRALQVFVPILTWAGIIKNATMAAWADAFTRTFIASFLITITGWLAAPNFSTWKSVLYAATAGAGAAGFRALQGLVTSGDYPKPDTGF